MSYPYVSFTFDTGAIHRIPELVLNALEGGKRSFVLSEEWKIDEGVPLNRSSKHMAWLSIMYGCNNFCTYCVVPYVRGRGAQPLSRTRYLSGGENGLVAGGCNATITLLGQNVNSYGENLMKDGRGCDFADLVEKDMRARRGLPPQIHDEPPEGREPEAHRRDGGNPGNAHASSTSRSRAAPAVLHEHEPTDYTPEEYLRSYRHMRETSAGIAISSDIMVGFPGETEEEFEETISMLEKVRFDMIYSFIYSPREGTQAAKMEQVPHEVSTARFERMLVNLQNAISDEKNERFVEQNHAHTRRGREQDRTPSTLTGRGGLRPSYTFPRTEGEDRLVLSTLRMTGAETFCMHGEMI